MALTQIVTGATQFLFYIHVEGLFLSVCFTTLSNITDQHVFNPAGDPVGGPLIRTLN